MGLFDGVSWSNPIGGDFGKALGFNGGQPTSLSNALNSSMTGNGTFWGPSDNKGSFGIDPLGWANSGSLGQGLSAMNGPMNNAFQSGVGTPWGPGDQKGLQATAPMNPANLLPGLNNYQQTLDSGVFGEKPAEPTYQTDPTKFTAPDYSDKLRADNQQVQQNLSRQQNDIVAGQQGRGALSSGSTGLGLSDALAGASNAMQGNAANIANMQTADQYRQMNDANQNSYNAYQSKMNKYGQGQQAIGQSLGAAAMFL